MFGNKRKIKKKPPGNQWFSGEGYVTMEEWVDLPQFLPTSVELGLSRDLVKEKTLIHKNAFLSHQANCGYIDYLHSQWNSWKFFFGETFWEHLGWILFAGRVVLV